DMIMKVKEPQESEYALMRDGLILFTYLHLAANESVTRALLERKVTAIGYETIQLEDGSLPLLAPMSADAGRLSLHSGACWRRGGRPPAGSRFKWAHGVSRRRTAGAAFSSAALRACAQPRL